MIRKIQPITGIANRIVYPKYDHGESGRKGSSMLIVSTVRTAVVRFLFGVFAFVAILSHSFMVMLI